MAAAGVTVEFAFVALRGPGDASVAVPDDTTTDEAAPEEGPRAIVLTEPLSRIP